MDKSLGLQTQTDATLKRTVPNSVSHITIKPVEDIKERQHSFLLMVDTQTN